MAVITMNPSHNASRLELLRKYREGLPFASGPYSSDINSIMGEAQQYADRTGESPLKEADIQRMGEAAYLRRANLYNYDPNAFRLQALSPELSGMFGTDNDVFRQRQLTLADALAARARGEGESVAGLQLQQGLEAQRRGLSSALASQRPGMSAGAGMRTMMRGYGNAAAQTNQAAALLRAQEILGAQQQLGSVLGQGRQGDLTSRQQLMQAMLADMQGRQNLELSRSQDLQRLYQMNPEAMVQHRAKKRGALATIGKNFGQFAGPINQLAGAAGSIMTMGGFGGGGTPASTNPYQANIDLMNAKVIP